MDGDSDSMLRWLWAQALGVVSGSPQRAAGARFCWGTLGATVPPKDDKAGAFCTRCPGHWLRASLELVSPSPWPTWHQSGVDGVDHGDVGVQIVSSSDTPSVHFSVSSPWEIKKNCI